MSEEDILQMNNSDNGSINNVLNGIHRECFGIWLLSDETDENYILFYVNNSIELSGLVCSFKISDKRRNELTLGFAKIVNQEYPKDTDLIETFNTFQDQIRTLLEKLNRFTYGNEIANQKGTLAVKYKDGIDFVPFLNKIKAFRDIFDSNIEKAPAQNGNKIYLMFNPRNGYTKIGRSINPKTREKTLQGEDPETEIIALWNSPKSIERELHADFSDKRIRGEWFKLGIFDLLKIKEKMNSL
ncbi:GIY-YIG nuclease family protein [Hyunsoonleella rubra]|uniref:GIY-YIG nuclease family protein n=1 Tax=Hyunsoonleella rubra TaxID=1737062 RepID=A0ABW5T707_9FLAO